MSTEPVTNGPSGEGGKYIDRIDPDDPEYIRQMRRPAEVKEDLNLMDDRKRVNMIMGSKAFREELEQLIDEQMKTGPHPTSLMALQQISELILPQHRLTQTSAFSRMAGGAAIPISDIRGVDSLNYTKGEKIHRGKTASLYRVAELLGWSGSGQSLITTRLSQDNEHYLTIPYGLLFQEVTAGNLVKIDSSGDVLDSGNVGLGVNRRAFGLHAAVHASRPDLKCIVMLRNIPAVSLSSLKTGLLPASQEAVSVGGVAYFDYSGDLGDIDTDTLARTLGPINKVLMLRNYGVLVGGQTVEDAFLMCKNLMTAVEIQMQLMPLGLENVMLPSEEVQERMREVAKRRPEAESGRRKWRRGEMEFEALMRHLDNAGYRTGHVYHEPMFRRDRRTDRVNSEVEIPPAVSSFTHEDDPKSPLTRVFDAQKKHHKTEWLNTPNTYKREEMEEVGTPNPKKYTKWVPEKDGAQGGTPVKVENPNQFAPQGENPKEYKEKFKAIKKEYYEERIDAGPQSRILEGVTWEEAQKMKEQGGHPGDSVIVVGAASKGIIQRDHQHNAVVYKQTYAANPFSGVDDDDMDKYQAQISGAQQGETDVDELVPGPDGKLISTEERVQVIQTIRQAQDDSAIQAPEKKIPPPTPEKPQLSPKPESMTTSLLPPVVESEQAPQAKTLPRGQSVEAAAAPKSATLPQDFQRSKSERKPKKSKSGVNGEQQLASPSKSQSSGDGTLDERSSREVSPTKEASGDHGSPEKGKKKKFRMPSFSKTKDKKVKDKKSAKQSQV